MFDKHYVGLNLTGFENNGISLPVSRVTLFVDDENVITAGDNTGLEIKAECPHATQEMANAILESVKGYKYQMFTADAATLDPAAELGDGITASGIYSVLSRLDDDGTYPDIAAPGEEELEDEFPTTGPLTQSFNRKVAETRAVIEKTAEEIRLEVAADTEGIKASIKLNADAIEQRVEKNGVIAAINLSSEEASIKANKISLEGAVSINGTFQIDASGYLRCTGGTIGGATINNQGISFNSGNSGWGLWGTTAHANIVIHAGANTSNIGGAPFRVMADGTIYATKANVTGAVNATSGNFDSVTIGNSTITGSSLSGSAGTISGGTYSSPTISGGSLSSTGGNVSGLGGTISRMGGSLLSATLSTCTTNGTTLTVAGGNITNNDGASVVGSPYASVRSGNYFLSISSGIGTCNTNFGVLGDFSVNGSKNRVMKTSNFGERLLDALEAPFPAFIDYGMAKLDENGICYINIDPIFSETVDQFFLPNVFLTKHGEGDIWVEKTEHDFFIAKGTPGLRFSWETVYAQRNATTERLRINGYDYKDMSRDKDFNLEADMYFERNTIDYEDAAYKYFMDFERSLTA